VYHIFAGRGAFPVSIVRRGLLQEGADRDADRERGVPDGERQGREEAGAQDDPGGGEEAEELQDPQDRPGGGAALLAEEGVDQTAEEEEVGGRQGPAGRD